MAPIARTGDPVFADAAGAAAARSRLDAANLWPVPSVVVVTGHYGTGKTNFALNLARDAAKAGLSVTLADMDVVNPYFRSSDYKDDLEAAGIEVIAPVLAGTSLDTPSLSGRLDAAVDQAYAEDGRVMIIDAGGDDVGATALGRIAPRIAAGPYTMLYVVNRYRNLTTHADEAVAILGEIERASHLHATAVVNNSHLKQATDADVVRKALAFGDEVASSTGLPLACVTAPISAFTPNSGAAPASVGLRGFYPVAVFVKTPWE